VFARLSPRTLWFLGFSLALLLLFSGPLITLLRASWRHPHHSQIVFIPFVAAGLMFLRRDSIFRSPQYSPRLGVALVAAGLAFSFWAFTSIPPSDNPPQGLSLVVAGIVLTWIAGFLGFYGPQVFKAAAGPLLMLILLIPLPLSAVEAIETALQHASAEATHVLFQIAATPVFRDGLTFSLPGVNVEVARECSGIRSSIALLITALVLGQVFLRSTWAMACLALITIPIAIIKNAARIATLSWLGVYVSPDFFYGDLHRNGGLPFSVLALAMLLPCLLVLRRWEANGQPSRPDDPEPAKVSAY
jgi:exosortase